MRREWNWMDSLLEGIGNWFLGMIIISVFVIAPLSGLQKWLLTKEGEAHPTETAPPYDDLPFEVATTDEIIRECTVKWPENRTLQESCWRREQQAQDQMIARYRSEQ